MLYDDEDDYNSRHERRMLTDEDRVTLYYGDEFDDEGDFHNHFDPAYRGGYDEGEPDDVNLNDYELVCYEINVSIEWEATTDRTFKQMIEHINEIRAEGEEPVLTHNEIVRLYKAFIGLNIPTKSYLMKPRRFSSRMEMYKHQYVDLAEEDPEIPEIGTTQPAFEIYDDLPPF